MTVALEERVIVTEPGLDGVVPDCLSDHELIEAMMAARRLASRAQAAELAAVAELARRRFAADQDAAVEVISPRDYLYDEVAQALTLTAASADDLVRFATELSERLPGTFAAMAAGDIDYAKARTLWHCTDQLTAEHAARIEASILPKARTQTTGQIRAKARRLIKRLDPDAAARRRENAERQRGVNLVETDDGTTHLTGTDLPADAASAAYGRINAIAAGLKSDGDTRRIDQLRADVFLALLRGTLKTCEPPADSRSAGDVLGGRGITGSGSRARSAATNPTCLSSSGIADELLGGAPVSGWTDADDLMADEIAKTARTQLAALTKALPEHQLNAVLNLAGKCITDSIADLRARAPGHAHGYRPPAAMRRMIEHRDKRCTFPGCRRPAHRCDADHTIPYHRGGPTCPSNLAMLCRHHHKLKQTDGWRVAHIWPGVLLWIAPTGHWTINAPADRE